MYALLDAAIGQKVWDEGFHWAHLDFLSRDVDQNGKPVETAKPLGYYYRAAPPDNGNGLGGFYDILGPNNFSVEDASYAKLRELSVSYHLGRDGASRALNAVDAFVFPNLRTFTVRLSTSF